MNQKDTDIINIIGSMKQTLQTSANINNEDIEKYALSGHAFYSMMNFDDLENPTPECLEYVANVINKTNKNRNILKD
jgi:hypothetical protein